jgi:dCTP deaminase
MSILTGPEIERLVRTSARADGEPMVPFVGIEPFDPAQVGPNSYDLRLSPDLLVYAYADELDVRHEHPTEPLTIPSAGFRLMPGTLYLASTVEWTETHGLVPFIEGRSSIGRLGISVHATAGFGDDGFAGRWTLEISCVHPVRVYAGMRVCQIGYETIVGERRPYRGRYQRQQGPIASRLHLGEKPYE